jgi:hypothetical protein
MTEETRVPPWQKWVALCLFVLVVLGIILGWHRFLADFWPIDDSRVGPNLVASVVQWALVLIAAALFYPPTRRWVEQFVQHHVDDVKAHITAEHAKVHEKLDRAEKLSRHIIEHHPDIPPFEE